MGSNLITTLDSAVTIGGLVRNVGTSGNWTLDSATNDFILDNGTDNEVGGNNNAGVSSFTVDTVHIVPISLVTPAELATAVPSSPTTPQRQATSALWPPANTPFSPLATTTPGTEENVNAFNGTVSTTSSVTVNSLRFTGYDTANYLAAFNTPGQLSFTAVPEPNAPLLLAAGGVANWVFRGGLVSIAGNFLPDAAKFRQRMQVFAGAGRTKLFI